MKDKKLDMSFMKDAFQLMVITLIAGLLLGVVYSVTFQPLHEDTEFVNIIEPGHSGFNFSKVDVRTPMTTKDQLKNQ